MKPCTQNQDTNLSKITVSEFPADTSFKSPSGWVGWIRHREANGRYAVSFENGIEDSYPGHLILSPYDKDGNELSIQAKSPHGGKRQGSGRKRSTQLSKKTKPMRIPLELVPQVEKLIMDYRNR